MFIPGLVSVSFRQNTPEEILDAMTEARLETVEWGGDIHVPAGAYDRAEEVYEKTAEKGISVAAYGSYYRLGEGSPAEREKVLRTAALLRTGKVRIWGGSKDSRLLSAEERARLAEEAGKFGEEAKAYGIKLCLECHNGTVTDDFASALSFFRECGADNVSGFWQPNQFRSEAYNKEAAEAYAPFCDHIHVFHWDSQKRYPLAMGESVWKDYLRIFRGREKNVSLMLEFMHNDDIGSLRETAETLRRWINEEEKRQ